MTGRGHHLHRRQFLNRTAAGLIGTVLTSAEFPAWCSSDRAVPPDRLAKLARGANVCRWFRGRRITGTKDLSDYITEQEAQWMREIGLTHVRLCLQPRVVMDQKTGEVRDEIAGAVDAAIARFHRAGLLVLVDLHNEDRPSELNPDWQEAFIKFWAAFAARLNRFDPALTMFEIINEPVFSGKEDEWNALNARLAAAIRKSAPSHTIMTSGPNWGGIDGLKKLKLLEEPNIVYSFHCYDPFAFTHQGATWAGPDVKPLRNVPYPSSPEAVAPLLPELEEHPGSKKMLENYGKQSWNKARLAAWFEQAIEWGARNGVPLYCGEFGVFRPFAKPEHRVNWFRDFGQILADHKIGWAVWGWDEGFGLDRQYVDAKPVVDQVVARALGLKAG